MDSGSVSKLESLTDQDRIPIGLTFKMVATFEALVDDARARRGEAMHHLKPLCEAFFYLYEARASEQRARLVLACALHERLKYWQSNPGSMLPDVIADVMVKADLSQGQPLPVNIKEVATRHPNLLGWYNRVYRLACEPATFRTLTTFSRMSMVGYHMAGHRTPPRAPMTPSSMGYT